MLSPKAPYSVGCPVYDDVCKLEKIKGDCFQRSLAQDHVKDKTGRGTVLHWKGQIFTFSPVRFLFVVYFNALFVLHSVCSVHKILLRFHTLLPSLRFKERHLLHSLALVCQLGYHNRARPVIYCQGRSLFSLSR